MRPLGKRLPLILLSVGFALGLFGTLVSLDSFGGSGAGGFLPGGLARESASSVVQKDADTGSPEPVDGLLCNPSPGGPLSFAWGPTLGVAVEPAGRFALYTRPDPRTGQPTDGSYPLLDGCGSGAPWYTNYAAVRVKGPGVAAGRDDAPSADSSGATSSGGRIVSLGLSTLEVPVGASGRVGGAGSARLGAVHDVGNGVSVRQELSVPDPPGGATISSAQPGLQIKYRVTNRSARPRIVAVRSTLNPGLAKRASNFTAGLDSDTGSVANAASLDSEATNTTNSKAASTLARYLVRGPSGSVSLRVRYEREISVRGISAVSSTASSRGSWSPGTIGPPPDEIIFAAPSTLYAADFTHDPRSGYSLPPAAAFAVFWKDLRLTPGETVTVSHRYRLPGRSELGSGQPRGPWPNKASATSSIPGARYDN